MTGFQKSLPVVSQPVKSPSRMHEGEHPEYRLLPTREETFLPTDLEKLLPSPTTAYGPEREGTDSGEEEEVAHPEC